MPILYRNLTSGRHLLIQSTLKLLGSMVMHGSSTTKELQETFNFSLKTLHGFLKIRKEKAGATGKFSYGNYN